MTNRRQVLVLNASFEPKEIVPDRRAVRLYMANKAEAVVYSDRLFRSPGSDTQPPTTILVPSVLRLYKYVVLPAKNRSVMLSTRNVLARDKYVCAYCDVRSGKSAPADTMDHVIPKARGGRHVWENVVACCRRHNHLKGNRTLAELGWTLRITPTRPVGVSAKLLQMDPLPEWMEYLQVA